MIKKAHWGWVVLAAIALSPSLAAAGEGEPATVTVGSLLFAQYDYELGSSSADYNAFDITRAYINVGAGLPMNFRVRVTPDIVRETINTATTVYGSLLFRLKYAYLEKDDVLLPYSWVKFGLHETPWLTFEEGIDRYRFQGTMFAEREGFIPGSADFGLGYLQGFPGEYGEIDISAVNGEGFKSAEANKFKSGQARVTIRPFPRIDLARGVRVSGFYEEAYLGPDQPKRMVLGMLSYEHRYFVFTGQYLEVIERNGPLTNLIGSEGFSFFLEGRLPRGWAAIARIDQLDPDVSKHNDSHTRQIYGIAYWLEWQRVNVGVLVDDEQVIYQPKAGKPYEHRLFFQTQVSF